MGQENVTHDQKKNYLIKTDPEMKEMIGFKGSYYKYVK